MNNEERSGKGNPYKKMDSDVFFYDVTHDTFRISKLLQIETTSFRHPMKISIKKPKFKKNV